MQEGIIQLLLRKIEVICKSVRSELCELGEGGGEERQPIQQEEEGFDCLQMVKKVFIFLQLAQPKVHAFASPS